MKSRIQQKVALEHVRGITAPFTIIPLEHRCTKRYKLFWDKPRYQNCFKLIYITGGAGTHRIDFRAFDFQAGTLFFSHPHQVHQFEPESEGEGYMLMFNDHFLGKDLVDGTNFLQYSLLLKEDIPLVLKMDQMNAAWVNGICRSIKEEFYKEEPFAKEEVLKSLLTLMLIKLERISMNAGASKKGHPTSEGFSQFQELLRLNYPQTRSVNEYAYKLGVSPKTLNNWVVKFTGKNAKRFIDERIMLECKRLLIKSELTLQEISEKLGFDEATNLVKFFKRYARMTPGQFRLREKDANTL